MSWTKIINELIIRALPFDTPWKRNALSAKYLSTVQLRGESINIKHNINVTRRTALVLGNNIEIEGKNNIDATAGIMIGDNCKIDKGVKISTRKNGSYGPVIIGSGQSVSDDIQPGTILPVISKTSGLSSYNGQIVFILSTGRSGSKAIAKLLNQHPDAECFHDVFPHINTWSCNLLYNKETTAEVEEKLNALYNSMDLGNNKVHGQSDQKLAPLVPVLAKMFPSSKFIWLIRNPSDFANSAYARGWFDNSEFSLEPNKKEYLKKQVIPSRFDADHRINGYKSGVFKENHWNSMTAFERICWYWTYWNELIEENLNMIPSDRSIKIKLKELEEQKQKVIDFLKLESMVMNAEKVNKAYYPKPDTSQWNEEMKSIFDQYCKEKMHKWGF